MQQIAPSSALVGGRFHYAWVIVGVTFLVLIASAGVRSVPAVLIVPLEQEFGWSRATVSFGVSINLLLFGLLGPFAASLVERTGVRQLIAGAFAILTVAIGSTMFMTQPWHLWLLWGGLVGAATGAVTSWLSATISNRWFVARRGIVVGILTGASAMGQLIFLPLLAGVVESIGWRAAVGLISIIAAIMVPIVLLLMRNFPGDIGLTPYGAPLGTEVVTMRAVPTGNPFKAAIDTLLMAVKSRDFRFLAFSFFVCGASTNGLIGTHLIPMTHDHGMTEVAGASLLAVMGIFNVMGTMGSGWLSDRYDNRRLLVWYYCLRGLSLAFLPFAFDAGVPGLAIFGVFYGLDWVATVPPTIRLTADHFGAARAGTVFAWMLAAHQVGASVAAYAAGATRTFVGDYQLTFFAVGALCLLAAAAVTRVRRPRFDGPGAVLRGATFG